MAPYQPGLPAQIPAEYPRHADTEKGLHRIAQQGSAQRREVPEPAPQRGKQKATPAKQPCGAAADQVLQEFIVGGIKDIPVEQGHVPYGFNIRVQPRLYSVSAQAKQLLQRGHIFGIDDPQFLPRIPAVAAQRSSKCRNDNHSGTEVRRLAAKKAAAHSTNKPMHTTRMATAAWRDGLRASSTPPVQTTATGSRLSAAGHNPADTVRSSARKGRTVHSRRVTIAQADSPANSLHRRASTWVVVFWVQHKASTATAHPSQAPSLPAGIRPLHSKQGCRIPPWLFFAGSLQIRPCRQWQPQTQQRTIKVDVCPLCPKTAPLFPAGKHNRRPAGQSSSNSAS